MPDIFMAYADTVYAADKIGGIVDLKDYLGDELKWLPCSALPSAIRPF